MTLPDRICDAHHHLWEVSSAPYVVADLLADTATVAGVTSTVFVECGAFYRESGPEHLRVVGETDWVAANADPITKVIVGAADLRLGKLAEEALDAHIAAAGGRFREIEQLVGEPGTHHHVAGQHEEWNGDQSERVDVIEHDRVRQGVREEPLRHVRISGGSHTGQAPGLTVSGFGQTGWKQGRGVEI